MFKLLPLVILTAASLQFVLDFRPASATGSRKVAVLLIDFQDYAPHDVTADQIREAIFTSSASVHAYYRENSFNQLDLVGKLNPSGDVFGWYTIPYNNNSPCNSHEYRSWSDSARNIAQNQGVDLSPSYANSPILYINYLS